MEKLKQLFNFINFIIQYIFYGDTKPNPIMEEPKILTNREKVYEKALSLLYTDASPDDLASDDLACSESVSNVLRQVYPDFPIITGTAALAGFLYKDKRFANVLEYREGVILVSPTGKGNGTIVGHCGIFGKDGTIMSNSSESGLWKQNYDINSWIKRYRKLGEFPLYFYEPL